MKFGTNNGKIRFRIHWCSTQSILKRPYIKKRIFRSILINFLFFRKGSVLSLTWLDSRLLFIDDVLRFLMIRRKQVAGTCIRLFRQRLSHNSVNAYATEPIGIMGCDCLAPLGRGSWCLARRKGKA